MWKNILERAGHFACRISKSTDTHSEYVILIAFHYNNGYTNAPLCYVIRALPVSGIRLGCTHRRNCTVIQRIFFVLGSYYYFVIRVFQRGLIKEEWHPCNTNCHCTAGSRTITVSWLLCTYMSVHFVIRFCYWYHSCIFPQSLALFLLMWRIWWAPNNASKWQMGFNSGFEGLIMSLLNFSRRK